MATGPEMFAALEKAIRGLGAGSRFAINTLDSYDLRKLLPRDLTACGFYEKYAEEISNALCHGDLAPLSRTKGVQLSISPDAPRLIPPAG